MADRVLRAARRCGAGVDFSPVVEPLGGVVVCVSRVAEPVCAADPCVEVGEEGLFAELVCAPSATLHASRRAVAADVDIGFMRHLR